jgi:hypothetical protein
VDDSGGYRIPYMLKWVRGARIDWKTGIVVIALALAAWAAVVYVSVRDFVPEEVTQPTPPSQS